MEELSVTKSHLSESKATAAARLDTRCASSRRLQPDCKQVSPRNFIVQEERFCREDCLQVKGFTICRSQRLISPFTYTIKCGIKGS